MEKMKLAALDRDALQALFETNNHLQQITQEEAWDVVGLQFDEISNCFKHDRHYTYKSHDHYTSFYITVDEADYTKFIDDLADADAMYGILADADKTILKRLQNKADFFEDVKYGYVDISAARENNFYFWYRSGVEKLAARFEDYLHGIEDGAQDSNYLLETFLFNVDEGYLDNMMTDGEKVYFEVCKG